MTSLLPRLGGTSVVENTGSELLACATMVAEGATGAFVSIGLLDFWPPGKRPGGVSILWLDPERACCFAVRFVEQLAGLSGASILREANPLAISGGLCSLRISSAVAPGG